MSAIKNNFISKTIFSFLIAVFVLVSFSFAFPDKNQALAQEQGTKIKVYFVYSKTCVFCAREKTFLDKIEKQYSQIEIVKVLISDAQNADTIKGFYQKYNVPSELRGATPLTFIEGKSFYGYGGDETTGKEIEQYIKQLIENGNYPTPPSTPTEKPIRVPLLGWEFYPSKMSPLPLAIILGTLDGFNACAMLALCFLLAVLVATGIRQRVILIGGTFIFVSALVYFLFTAAWLNLFLVSRHLGLITFIVGIIVIFFALLMLKDYFYGIVCRLCHVNPGQESRATQWQRKLLEKMKVVSSSKGPLPLILLGVAAVAAGVNTVELVCSFGFPMAFTKVLSSLGISTFYRYLYILVYIFFYMLDDLLIFLLAVFTLRITSASEKYLKLIKLISGIVLLILGLIMIFKPELLSFM